jgi:hypothetical protein
MKDRPQIFDLARDVIDNALRVAVAFGGDERAGSGACRKQARNGDAPPGNL